MIKRLGWFYEIFRSGSIPGIILIVVACFPDIAGATVCQPVGAPGAFVYDLTHAMTAQENTAGHEFDVSEMVVNRKSVICPGGSDRGNTDTYRSYRATKPLRETVGQWKYLQVNDYLEIALRGVDSATGEYYPPVDYFHEGHSLCVKQGCPFIADERNFTMRFKVIKPFIGAVNIPYMPLFNVYDTTNNYDPLTTIVYTIGYKGTITVPQSCEIQPDSVFDIDLGQIAQKSFVQGGAGNRPSGFINRPLTVKVSCVGGVSADALLNVRLEGTIAPGYPHALASDNQDIGVVITKPDGTTILNPNDINSIIPMQLQNGSSSVVIQSYPISLTGKSPDIGLFSTLAYLRFDFS